MTCCRIVAPAAGSQGHGGAVPLPDSRFLARISRMTRVVTLAGVACLLAAAVEVVSAQVVPVTEDPNHRVRLDMILLRILEVNLSPGDTTLDHRHERDVASIALTDSTTRTRGPEEDWGAPRMRARGTVNVTNYTDAPGVHRVNNIGTTPYHLIAVENLRSGGWSTTRVITAPGTALLQQTRAFAIYDVRLDAGTPQTNHAHEMPIVAVLVSGAIENQGGMGENPSRFDRPGQWIFIPGGHTMNVAGTGGAHVVEVEVR